MLFIVLTMTLVKWKHVHQFCLPKFTLRVGGIIRDISTPNHWAEPW